MANQVIWSENHQRMFDRLAYNNAIKWVLMIQWQGSKVKRGRFGYGQCLYVVFLTL